MLPLPSYANRANNLNMFIKDDNHSRDRILTDSQVLMAYMFQNPTVTEWEARQELGLPLFDNDE